MSTAPASMSDDHDLAEMAVLGAALFDSAWLEDLPTPLKATHFAVPVHARIWQQIQDIMGSGQVPNVLSVYRALKGDPDLTALGGVSYLNNLQKSDLAMVSPIESAGEVVRAAEVRSARDALRLALIEIERPDADPGSILEALNTEGHTPSTSSAIHYEWAGDVEPVLDGAWLIDDFLAKAGPAVMFGHPGSGKTFLALDIAAHVAEGKPWAGRHVEGGPVLYVVAEGLTGFKNRLAALFDDGRMKRDAPFVYVPTPINLQAPDGDTGSLIATLKHFARKVGRDPALIVLDTLSKTFGGAKENTDDMASYVANCERVAAAFNCLTLIIHHRPRDADAQNERGHSSLRGGVVTSILVDGSEIKTATTVKQKDGPEHERVTFQLTPVPVGRDSRGKEVTTCLLDIVDNDFDDGGSASRRLPLKGNKRIAFEALETLIALHGQTPPMEIPAESLDRWKVERVISAGQAADKLRAEFQGVVNAQPDKISDTARRTASRALNDLKSAGILGSWEEWLWLQ